MTPEEVLYNYWKKKGCNADWKKRAEQAVKALRDAGWITKEDKLGNAQT